jgi:acetate kinase
MILVLNSGSSSIKYRLFESGEGAVLAGGLIERIGETDAAAPPDHRTAIQIIVERLREAGHLTAQHPLTGIGHRVVHGGEAFRAAVRIDPFVIHAIRDAIPLAPLHNPPNLLGIEICRDLWPGVPQVAVFDTAFHLTMPPSAYRYALPQTCYTDLKIRRYGFHGTSFARATRQAAAALDIPIDQFNAVILHLGNGASMAAVAAGRCVDTSMGMTPLAGLVMGTRSGDLDPGVVLYLLAQGLTVAEVDHLLNRDSGLKGITSSNDMRDVLAWAEEGDAAAGLALDVYIHRIRFYLGGYLLQLKRVDALIFTGGVGEHAPTIRQRICAELDHLGIQLDDAANHCPDSGLRRLETPGSPVALLLIPADEEREIAEQTGHLVSRPWNRALR